MDNENFCLCLRIKSIRVRRAVWTLKELCHVLVSSRWLVATSLLLASTEDDLKFSKVELFTMIWLGVGNLLTSLGQALFCLLESKLTYHVVLQV